MTDRELLEKRNAVLGQHVLGWDRYYSEADALAAMQAARADERERCANELDAERAAHAETRDELADATDKNATLWRDLELALRQVESLKRERDSLTSAARRVFIEYGPQWECEHGATFSEACEEAGADCPMHPFRELLKREREGGR